MSDSLWPHGLSHGILLQARILEGIAFPFSRGSSQPKDQTQVSHIAGRFFSSWATIECNPLAWIPAVKICTHIAYVLALWPEIPGETVFAYLYTQRGSGTLTWEGRLLDTWNEDHVSGIKTQEFLHRPKRWDGVCRGLVGTEKSLTKIRETGGGLGLEQKGHSHGIV